MLTHKNSLCATHKNSLCTSHKILFVLVCRTCNSLTCKRLLCRPVDFYVSIDDLMSRRARGTGGDLLRPLDQVKPRDQVKPVEDVKPHDDETPDNKNPRENEKLDEKKPRVQN